jgi:hypothetical protein
MPTHTDCRPLQARYNDEVTRRPRSRCSLASLRAAAGALGLAAVRGHQPDGVYRPHGILEDVWRIGQGTMTGTGGPSGSTSIRSMTSVDERDEQVLKHRLLDGMHELRGSKATTGESYYDGRGRP